MPLQSIVTTVSYNETALIAAARGRGISVVEVQHGALNLLHPGYLYTGHSAKHRARLLAPDHMGCFGPYWVEDLRAGGFWNDEPFTAGHPRGGRRITEPRSGTLITMQAFQFDRLLELGSAIARAIPDETVYVKLHPGAREKIEAPPGLANLKVLGAFDSPSTTEILDFIGHHITIMSSTVIEAMSRGVPSLVIPGGDLPWLTRTKAMGVVREISRDDEAVELIAGKWTGDWQQGLDHHMAAPFQPREVARLLEGVGSS